MGKKVKKDDKGPPEDVFDPLLVESKQAATVVLMLDSPEDDVQAKACEAIYKFVNKCDENKKVLFDLSACDQLFGLLSSEEKVVRRNAIMALGVMTAIPEVRKYIRKRPECVQSIIRLLNPEEFDTTHEFGTLALTNLCQEYTNIATILDNNGVEPLVECLGSDDPDVQKNSIECLSLLLQDFEARSAIREGSGLESMLNLLGSEYPVIQEFTLTAFARATQDAGNRAAMRELECIKSFVNIIGNQTYNDVHVHAMHVLANLLDDVECLQQMKESGGLSRLVAFITDAEPPTDEQKGDKAKKGGKGSAKGKKGKGDDDGRNEEKVPSHTMPEVKMHCCKAIMRSAKSEDNRKVLHEADAEKMLIALLSYDDETVKVAAAEAIAVMAESSLVQDTISKLEGIEIIVRMVKNDAKDIKEAGALAVANLTTGNTNICHEVASHHGIEYLIGCLQTDHERIQSNALTALTNMSTSEPLRHKIITCGFVAAIVTPLSSMSTTVQSKAGMACAAFITDLVPRTEFRTNGGLEPLVRLLSSNHSEVRRSACWAVTQIAVDEETAKELYRLNALEILQSINNSETKRNRFSELALGRLYDNNLTIKYALSGYLNFTDRINDEFYDAGQLKPGSKLLSVSDYGLQPINNRRCIILINTKLSGPANSTSVADTENKTEDKNPTRRPTKGRGKKEKAIMEQETITQEQPEPPIVYNMPDDATLLKYMQDALNTILPLHHIREQVVTLARYVSDAMGGPIERGQLMNFSWELPLSQIKYTLKSNVIPIGLINYGIHIHRALLFKFLADKIGVAVSLCRGEYNRAWNEVLLSETGPTGKRYPPSLYIVDLIHNPGDLLLVDSIEANNYIKI